MKKWLIGAVVVLAGAGAFYWFVWRSHNDQEEAPVETAKVERGPIRTTVAATGRVVSNRDVDIKCKAGGEVAKLPFDVSDVVKEGDLLLELDPVDEERVVHQMEVVLRASEAKRAIARQNLVVAERTLETDGRRAEATLKSAKVQAQDAQAKAARMTQLLEKRLVSQEECDTAETAAIAAAADLVAAEVRLDELRTQETALELRRQEVALAQAQVESDEIALSIAQDRLRDTKVMSPIDGVVAARNVQIGQIISSGISNVGGGTTVLTLSDLSHVFFLASVDESDIGKVRLEQDVEVTADAFRGRTFAGKVVRIATRGVNVSNVVTFEVRIEVTGEARSLLKPEMTANVEIVTDRKADALLVQAEAVFTREGRSMATVVRADGTREDVAVETGLRSLERTEITGGLEEGRTVVVHRAGSDGRWGADARPATPPPGKRGPL